MTPTPWRSPPWYFQGAFLKCSEILQGPPKPSTELILSPHIPAEYLLPARQEALRAGFTTWRETDLGPVLAQSTVPCHLGSCVNAESASAGLAGAREPALLTDSQVILLLLVQMHHTLSSDVPHPKEWLREIDAQQAT